MQPIGPSAKYFEDFAPGNEFVTQGRTIGEAENAFFTMFSGDMNPMHVDEVHAKEHGLFGGRFPSGMMVVAVAAGLQERMGLFAGTGLAMLGQSMEYHKPVLIGDTIHVRMIVKECVPSKSRPAGRVVFDYQIIRQDGDVCTSGLVTYYVLGRDV